MKIINSIDKFLDQTPMYTLVLYILNTFILAAFGLSIFGILDYSIYSLLYSLVTITAACLATNFAAAKIFKIPFQHESSVITAFILFFILVPIDSLNIFAAALIASTASILSKYLLAYKNTHIFNPAAFGLFFAGLFGFGASFWWIGNIYLFPLVAAGALLLVRKVKKMEIVLYAVLANILGMLFLSYFYEISILTLVQATFISGPIIFFLGFMATEPHTLPGRKIHQIIYIIFIILFPILFNTLGLYSIAPETALILANGIFMFVSKRSRAILKLENVQEVGKNIFEYNFISRDKIDFTPGQYAEILLPHTNPDIRGTRRYFTISSIPKLNSSGENMFSFATKYPVENMSSFKTALKKIDTDTNISATQFGGDFLLPYDLNQKLVFIAGGIGVTPFISFIRHMLDKNESREIIFFYCARNLAEIAYKDLLKQVNEKNNIKIVLVLVDIVSENSFQDTSYFSLENGYLTKEILIKYINNPVFYEYYLSGPNSFVNIMSATLKSFEMRTRKIHIDYFPGF